MHVNPQDQKITHTNYKNMIQAWLRSDCHIYFPFVSFWLKNKNALIAQKKWILILIHVIQLLSQKP